MFGIDREWSDGARRTWSLVGMASGASLIAVAFFIARAESSAPDSEPHGMRVLAWIIGGVGGAAFILARILWSDRMGISLAGRVFGAMAFIAFLVTMFWDVPPPADPLLRTDPVAIDAPVDLGAAEILQRMSAAYAGCRTYADHGVVRSCFHSWPEHTVQLEFMTAFERAGGFKFEYQEFKTNSILDTIIRANVETMVIWGDTKRVRMWWTVNDGSIEESTLENAVMGALGVSASSSYSMPRMLMPDRMTGESLGDLRDPSVTSIDSFEGHECYRVSGTFKSGPFETLWIDRKTFLVRRIEEGTMQLDDGVTVEQVTAYDPIIDAATAPAEFTFTPPK